MVSTYFFSAFEIFDTFCAWFNNQIASPATILFFGVGVLLTFMTGFLQVRGFPHFISLITKGVARNKGAAQDDAHGRTISSFHALFTAMATTIGMGNVVGPSVAIFTGGPGALFWLLVYIFFASVTKFAEVIFAIRTRERMRDGYIVGGPMNYLKKISPALAYWYGLVIIFLFISWSALQANTLAAIYAKELVPEWIIGLGLAALVFVTLIGGAQRIGIIASKLVPLMFVLYVAFAGLILLQDPWALVGAFKLIMHNIFSPQALCGGTIGFGILHAMRAGIYRAIFITEAGIGTSSIAHAITDAKNPTDQGILALFSMAADGFLAMLSGLIVLVTGVCMQGTFRSTLIYEAFKLHSPAFGSYVLLASVTLFVLTTVMGNSFNGVQSFSALTRHRWVNWYIAFTTVLIFAGALLPVQFMWNVADMLLTLVALPNLIGVLILSFKNPDALELKK